MSFFSTLAGKMLLSFLVSMVPVIELRGGLPLAYLNFGLPLWLSIIVCIIGNMLPIPFILLFLNKILNMMENWGGIFSKFYLWLNARAEKKGKTLEKGEILGICILVAIPLPGTGAWTGALVATLMKIPPKKALPAIFLGVVIAAVIVSIASWGVDAIF